MINFKPRRKDYRYQDLPEGQVVSVEIGYEKGGMSYFSGGTERRGIYLYVRQTEIKNDGSFRSERFTLFDSKSFKYFLKEQGRLNAKQVAQMAEKWDEMAPKIAEAFRVDPAEARAMVRLFATNAGLGVAA